MQVAVAAPQSIESSHRSLTIEFLRPKPAYGALAAVSASAQCKHDDVSGCQEFAVRTPGTSSMRALGDKVKLRRAHGGCLGDERRRRTWTAAKSFGEPLAGNDPEISEWDNPRRDYLPVVGEFIAAGSEPGELKHLSTRRKRKQTVIPLVAASERGTA